MAKMRNKIDSGDYGNFIIMKEYLKQNFNIIWVTSFCINFNTSQIMCSQVKSLKIKLVLTKIEARVCGCVCVCVCPMRETSRCRWLINYM